MELENYKQFWQNQGFDSQAFSSRNPGSTSMLFFRASLVRDLQRRDGLTQLVFSILSALVIAGVPYVVGPTGPVRIAALLLAAALLFDGIVAALVLPARCQAAATSSRVDFVRKERQGLD